MESGWQDWNLPSPGPKPGGAPSPLHPVLSSPPRIRTWNSTFEASHDDPFHQQAVCFVIQLVEHPARDLNPHHRLERPASSPLDERGMSQSADRFDSSFCLQTSSLQEWVGRRSNPRLRFFRPPLNHLSYRPASVANRQQKSPMSRDTGLCNRTERQARCHKRRGHGNVFAD